MFADAEAHSGSFEESRRRWANAAGATLRVAGPVVAVAASLFALALVTASAAPAATVFTHSARGGQLGGGKLTLRGVGRQVSWVTTGGRSGLASVQRTRRLLFSPGAQPASGTLHITGTRGDELALSLSRMRYNASRRTISYRTKPLNNRPQASRPLAQGSGFRRFGAASLSIINADGGNDCVTYFVNSTGSEISYVANSAQTWPTDWWAVPIANGATVPAGNETMWYSSGNFDRGCWSHAVWQFASDPNSTFTFDTEWDWGWSGPQFKCSSSNPDWTCVLTPQGNAGPYWNLQHN